MPTVYKCSSDLFFFYLIIEPSKEYGIYFVQHTVSLMQFLFRFFFFVLSKFDWFYLQLNLFQRDFKIGCIFRYFLISGCCPTIANRWRFVFQWKKQNKKKNRIWSINFSNKRLIVLKCNSFGCSFVFSLLFPKMFTIFKYRFVIECYSVGEISVSFVGFGKKNKNYLKLIWGHHV